MLRTRTGLLPLLLLLLLAILPACTRRATPFSEQNARAHVEMLAGTIGSRPPGTSAHRRAREYVIDQLRLYGFEVRVQETDARRPELGVTARVANVIGVLPGSRPEAVGLVSHYDSRADTPGAGDDAFGVAVSLEAARLVASMQDRQWTTYVLVTDAEEQGLMGAAAIVQDPQVRDNLAAYINLESIGSAGPVMLFETGPGNAWLASHWARSAPRPRGGSFAVEIYKRLPNDTDFSILKRHQVPGLNFALVGNSAVYHTARDTPDRVEGRALRDAGDNVVGIVAALQRADITRRTDPEATYFDIGGVSAVSYGSLGRVVTTGLAVLLGLLAWFRVTRFLVREEGAGRWALAFVWSLLGFAVSLGAMVAATGLVRAAREAYHPWYAHPDRFFVHLAVVGATAAWIMARAGRWIPARAKGIRHPAVVWTSALPAWILLALVTSWFTPAAAYLWTLPLLTAGLILTIAPPASPAATRLASIVILMIAATFWFRDTIVLLRFMVAVFGRQPIVTPVFVYAVLLGMAGIMLLPPLFAAAAAPRPLLRPALATAVLLAGVAGTAWSAWMAPAYTSARPLRAILRAIQEPGAPRSVWQMGALEPGIDLADGSPHLWTPGAADVLSVPWGRLAQPFVFSSTGDPLGEPPATVSAFNVTSHDGGAGSTVSIAVVPKEPALTVSFVLPPGLTPARSNLPGVLRQGRWTTIYVGPPAEGIAWQGTFAETAVDRLREIRVAVTSSGLGPGEGAQRLPPWLPRERTVWTSWFTWVLDPSSLEPVPPLR